MGLQWKSQVLYYELMMNRILASFSGDERKGKHQVIQMFKFGGHWTVGRLCSFRRYRYSLYSVRILGTSYSTTLCGPPFINTQRKLPASMQPWLCGSLTHDNTPQNKHLFLETHDNTPQNKHIFLGLKHAGLPFQETSMEF